MSNPLRKRRAVTGGAEIGPGPCTRSDHHRNSERSSSLISVAKKQRFIDATKMLLDIANEASDAFPPLKSCLGGINALIKYYEVRVHPIAHDFTDVRTQGCKDVEDNLRDLVLWLTKLRDGMATTSSDENPPEMERREQLTRFLPRHYRLADSS